MNVLHCNIPPAFPAARAAEGQEARQWNASARVLLDAKPVTSLEVIRQSECKEGHMTVEKLLHFKVHVHRKLATEERK